MPTYEYACGACGGFDALRPIAEREGPCACPGCGAPSPRVTLTPPGLSRIDGGVRRAHAINERSAHAPGCGCASHAAAKTGAGIKGFPGKRPWMIGH